MEQDQFDALARATAGGPTRRTLVQGIVALLASSGLMAETFANSEAGKSKKKKQQQKKKQEKKKEKKQEQKRECGSGGKVCATPTNPCQTVACVDFKCVTSTRANGATCGNGLRCESGACVCPGGVCNVTVSPSDMAGWVLYNEQTNEPVQASFVTGPETPPAGTGSAQLQTVVSQNKQMMSARMLNGTRLDELDQLSYWTYVNSAEFNTAPHFQIGITRNIEDPKDFWEGRLVFAPDYTTAVVPGEWQEWNVLDPSRPWFFLSKGDYQDPVTHCTQGVRCTFPEVLQKYPGIAINPVGPSPSNNGSGWGLIGIMVGSGEGVVNSTFDKVTVEANGTTYVFNFDPSS